MLLKQGVALSLSTITLIAGMLSITPEAVRAQDVPRGKSEYDRAMQLYKKRNYHEAGELFWQSVVAGNTLPIAWLMTAHCKAGEGNATEARTLYREIIKTFKGTKEAGAAKTCLIKLKGVPDTVSQTPPGNSPATAVTDRPASEPAIKQGSDLARAITLMHKKDYGSALAYTDRYLKNNPNDPNGFYYQALCHHYRGNTNKAIESYGKVVAVSPDSNLGQKSKNILAKLSPGYSIKAPASSPAKKAPAVAKSDPPFINKIEVLPSGEGRVEVRDATVETARDVVRKLPPKIAEMLYKGDAKISLASNRVDRFKYTQHQKEEKNPNVFMHARQSETVGREACVYDSGMWRVTGRLKPPYPQTIIRKNLLRELGNVISDINGKFTNVEAVKKAYEEDKSRLSGNIKSLYPKYVEGEPEGFERTVAEIIAGYIGANDQEAQYIRRGFPRLNSWIKMRMGF